MEFDEDNYLQLSGIQHYLFCRRQWALIHIEQQWEESYHTADGRIMHKNVHDPSGKYKRNGIFTICGMRVHSSRLGVSGECDVVEFYPDPKGVTLSNTDGRWIPFPVEYKRGSRKVEDCDITQLCAQAMCLEEMLCTNILEGAVFYGEQRRRQHVEFTPELRQKVEIVFQEMHDLYERGHTPKAKQFKGCDLCSLKNVCMPEAEKTLSVKDYKRKMLKED